MAKNSNSRPLTGLEIAVIGMAGRFPQAEDIDAFWQNVKNGVEAITFTTVEELREQGARRELVDHPLFVPSFGGVLEGRDLFDAAFFDYTPMEATVMNPQLRVFHECAWHTLEDGGYDPFEYEGLIGLYAGASSNYLWTARVMLSGVADQMGQFAAFLMHEKDFMATRVAYKLNLTGPAVIVNTACSTSLSAIHIACRALLMKECDMALAGGVGIRSLEDNGYIYEDGMIRSPDGHCRAFDAEARGTINGDGVGLVLLKPYKAALKDRDHIHALILASALNNDGTRKVGYTAPSVEGESVAIKTALRLARIEPETITYVETHGTGTVLGDPIEIEALKKAFNTEKRGYCGIGSVKTNVGHLDAAAGVTGVIKTILALKNRQIPPSINFESPNPNIDFKNSPFYVNTTLKEWQNPDAPLRAGVSAFGIGGTNAHLLLEEAPPSQPANQRAGREFHLLLWSAKSAVALNESTALLREHLKRAGDDSFEDIAYTLATGRHRFGHRRMLVCRDGGEAVEILDQEPSPGVFSAAGKEERRPVVFMFPGQGSQYVNMGRDLYRHEPVFKEEMDRCFELLESRLSYDIKGLLFPDGKDAAPEVLNQTETAQLVIFTVEYALAKLLISWGVKPDHMMGHSIGEYTAACLAGVFSLEEALRIVAARGRLMQSLPGGSMLSVAMKEGELRPLLDDSISLAAANSTANCVVSGPHEAVDAFQKKLEERQVHCRRLHVSHAFHSQMMEPVLDEFKAEVAKASLNPPRQSFISNGSGKAITGDEAVDPSYWSNHIRNTVHFGKGAAELLKKKNVCFIEVGPGKALSTFVRNHEDFGNQHAVVNLMRHPQEDVEDHRFLTVQLGHLWLQGVAVDWRAFYSAEEHYRVPLPTYPFQRQSYWLGPEVLQGQLSSKPQKVKRPDAADWFYVPTWKQAVNDRPPAENYPRSVLLFGDQNCLSGRMTQWLKKRDIDVITVQDGKDLDMADENSYLDLFRRLQDDGRLPSSILYLWPLEKENLEEALDACFYGLLFIARSLGAIGGDNSYTINVAGAGLFSITGYEELNPLQALVTGPVRAISQEYPNIDCRLMDVDPADQMCDALDAELLWREWWDEAAQPVSALRGRRLWIPDNQPKPLEKADQPPTFWREGGVYLITGGLGGMGLAFARHLAETVKPKLVLTSRSEFPKPDQWRNYIETHGQDDSVGAKISLLLDMEVQGAEVMVLQADVSSREQMETVRDGIHRRFGPVNGVIHSAGVADGGLIQARTREMTDTVLAPKVLGTMLLAELFDADEPDFMVLCSSLSSVLSIYGNVGYGAANAFMDAFAHSRNQNGSPPTVSINWDTWQEVGMAVEALKKRNVQDVDKMLSHGILPAEGFDALTRILNRRFPQVLVSTIDLELLLDSQHWSQPEDGDSGVMDTIEKMTKSESMMDRPELSAPYEAPRDRLEEKLAEIWQEYFGFHQVGVHDDFFELGGDSLRGMMFVNKYKELLGEIVHVTAIFNAPTIAALADYFKEHYPAATAKIIDPSGKSLKEESSEVVTAGTIGRIRSWLPPVAFVQDKDHRENPPAVFVLAPPRSGSTLLRVILGGHPGIFSPPELGLMFFNRLADDRSDSQAAVRALMEIRGCDAEEGKAALQEMREQGLSVQDFYRHLQEAVAPQLLVDKTPGYALYPEVLERMERDFENAYFIHLLRHPYGMISSAVEAKIDLLHGSDTLKDLNLTRRQFSELMYVICHQNIEAFLADIPARRQYRLAFEDLVREPGQRVQELCDFLGLDIHQEMLQPYGETKKRMTDGIHAQSVMVGDVKFHNYKKIEPAIADSWKKKIKEDFMGDVTRQLAQSFGYSSTDTGSTISIQPAPSRDTYPLSSAQKRLFMLEQFEGSGVVYNMAAAHIIDGALDIENVQQTFRALIARHEALRTSFQLCDGEPAQQVHTDVEFSVEVMEAKSEEEILERIHKFVKPFDLGSPPLLRVMAITLEERRFVLAYDLHHIISDGFSNRILLEEFNRLYRGEELEPLPLQYKDFAWWEHTQAERGTFREQEGYWLRTFSGELPVLRIPTDFPRPGVQSFSGKRVRFQIDEQEADALKALAAEENVTLFMLLLAVFYILLHKLSLQEDLIVGTPIAGRRHADMHRVMGMFVNTLALRGKPCVTRTFSEFLAEVRTLTIDAFDNQEYQFEELVEKVVVQRDMSRNPLVDTLFSLQRRDAGDGDRIEELATGEFQYDKPTVKFDLELMGHDHGRSVRFLVNYCDALFKEETVLRFVDYFKVIVNTIIGDPQRRLGDISIISQEERRLLLEELNHTATDYPAQASVHELFARQVRETPLHTALISGDLFLSYEELYRQSDLLASELQSRGCGPEDVVAVLMDRTSSVAVSYLAILRCGAGYMPVSTDYPPQRLAYVWNDSRAKIVMTDNIVNFEDVDGKGLDVIRLHADRPVETDGKRPWKEVAVPSGSLVYIIYTSGSTGMPKGVMVEHKGVVRLVKETDYFEFLPGDRFLQTCALEFDVSTFEFWGTLLNGLTLCVAPKAHIISPSSIKRLIRRLDIGSMWMTVALFNQLSQEDIDIFNGLRRIICGGDALSPYHINRFRRYFPDMTVVNGYGPTENTSLSTAHTITGEYPDNVPIGRPLRNSTAYILDRQLRLCPLGVSGELCTGGDGVARGYLNRPELTAQRFVPNPFKAGDVLYRTGDLARYLADGTIEFLGRLDFQVKIRGFRIELGEIENRLLDIDGIGDAVVLVREHADGEKYLCGYIVSSGELDDQSLKDQLGRFLPDYMIPSHFVALDEIPLTASGKVDRRALPEPDMDSSGACVPPADHIEKTLAVIWSDVLGIESDSLSVTADFFRLGGHSLKATIMVGRIHRELDVQVTITDIFRSPTVRRLAAVIREAKRQAFETIPRAEKKDYYPVSSAQSRLYFLQRMDVNATVYNLPHGMRISGNIDIQRIESVFGMLIERHESFRTCFSTVNDEPVQRIHDHVDFSIQMAGDMENRDERQLLRRHIRPFDLSEAPLLRVAVAVLGEGEYLLLVDMHHIISDGTSLEVLTREFDQLFNGGELGELAIQYKDFAQWQQCGEVRSGTEAQNTYWLEVFADDIPVLMLPYDFPRPELQSYDGAMSSFRIGARDTRRLRDLAHRHGATLYIVLISLFNLLLSKLTGQEDIVVGTPLAGRRHADLESVIGMFVNTLALRNAPAHDLPWSVFLEKVKARVLPAFEHQDVQFEELVERLSISRDAGRNPLFDVMFVLQNTGDRRGAHAKDSLYAEDEDLIHEADNWMSRFDMTWTAVEWGEYLYFNVEYCSRLFKKETIRRFVRYFKTIVGEILENHSKCLGDICIIGEAERRMVVEEFNVTTTDYPGDQTIFELFVGQAAQTPNRMAVLSGDLILTYGELNRQADVMASKLSASGCGDGTTVGVMMKRNASMVVAVLAALRCGSAYMPINSDYPPERIAYLLKDSATNIIVTDSEDVDTSMWPEHVETVLLPPGSPVPFGGEGLPYKKTGSPASLAYIIYTSGSTGKPKGVMVQQKSVARLVKNTNYWRFSKGSRLLQTSALEFDGSTFEIWGSLLNGFTLCLAPREAILSPIRLKAIIRRWNIDIMWMTVALFNQMVMEDIDIFKGLQQFLVGGDALSPFHINRLRKQYPSLSVTNGYGPTENTTFSTTHLIRKEYSQNIPIGTPIANSTVYILDQRCNPQPLGVPGELCVGGDGVARGYMNQPELSSERFIENPFRSGDRLYRTGDLARFLADGTIEFMGRFDTQVKIRGFRIEPGEIENYLLGIDGVDEAVVLARKIGDNEKFLCAYVVASQDLDGDFLKEELAKSLPDYMVPPAIMFLESIPLTINGKVDRRSLPEPEIDLGQQYIAPSSVLEERLAAIWAELLSIDAASISMDADFFKLGGHSLRATVMASKIHKELDVEVSLMEIFRAPTIRDIAAVISAVKWVEGPETEIDEDHEEIVL
jgi:amino acid adenylation domain-containing protein